MSERGDWTLPAWIAHAEQVRGLETRLREAEQRQVEIELAALREMHQLQVTMNNIHFEQLNENAKRTIEERGHFVSVEAFLPFKEQVAKYMATNEGETTGASSTVSWGIALAGFLIGFAGVVVAIVSLLMR